MSHAILVIVAICATFFAAGLVKGVSGMGLPTVAMGVLGALMSPVTAAGLLLVPSFVTNLWQLLTGPGLLRALRRFWPMMLAVVLGSILGSAALTRGNAAMTTGALGGALIVYALYTLRARPKRVFPRWERRLSPLIGGITGVVTGCTGVFVFPAVPYLQALGLEKDDLVQTLGLSFTTSTIGLALGLVWHGRFRAGNLLFSSLMVAPALLGMWVGQSIRGKIDDQVFRKWFLYFLIALGFGMLLQGFL
ncbi:sulfite exporter TauE/SafE family protein [Acidisoma silvae]|uniref:Probable membrane transporter protein n=1 Tax=Acidisoma silvae TaxID=2802396 RepID=A0A963YW08_9PROT|nr:sulfite exporter TauE/SafE family protein [Acidisoma silvae]MCB8877976.1 sulfite exporter TauE/SafE family protein [Acidisoma silvae]